MKYLDEYRDPQLAEGILSAIHKQSARRARIMEICGTHTVTVFRSGLKKLLPPTIELVSGPGCPVCVTASVDIDKAILLCREPGVIVATFGDLVRVPGSRSSLEAERRKGADVRIVYASFDALEIAQRNPDRHVVLVGIGFETTAPTVAAAIRQAAARDLRNFSVFSVHKLLPPVMRALLEAEDLAVSGFLCPGHVSTVIGSKAYEPIAGDYGAPCVVTGFEPLDLLQGIAMLVDQLESGRAQVENQYRRAVTRQGNRTAQAVQNEVFRPVDAPWRGLGAIPRSGLGIRRAFAGYDALQRFELPAVESAEPPGCRCGQVLRGALAPSQCPLFGKACTPRQPMGPCMVSSEGACGTYYRYGEDDSKSSEV